jgi:retron-type reverse transcriptase
VTEFENICSFESLYAAHKTARLSKRDKTEVIRFEMRLSENILKLKEALESGEYKVAGYKRFLVFDPKTREIQALGYGDRVVQHSICDRVLSPYFERRLIYDNAACRVGKGTHFAMDRLSGFLRGHYKRFGAGGYVLKCDIAKYFDSIDHTVLKGMLEKCGFDPNFKSLLFGIIDSYSKTENKGLPIGNQTSQFFALLYLDPLDRLVKEKLGVKYYTRYMDDFILVHNDINYLRGCLRLMKETVENVLKLKFNAKTQITPLHGGVEYLGFRFFLTGSGKVLRLLKHAKKMKIRRMIKKLVGLPTDADTQKYVGVRVNAVRAHLAHGNTYRFLRTLESL